MTAKGDVEREIRTQSQRLQNCIKITGKVFRDWDDLNTWLGDYCRKYQLQKTAQLFAKEKLVLSPLPPRDEEVLCKVKTMPATSYGTVRIAEAIYSVPDEAIGVACRVVASAYQIKIYRSGGKEELLAVHQRKPEGESSLPLEHILPSLIRKPRAMVRWAYRDILFPEPIFKRFYERLRSLSQDGAEREYLRAINLVQYTTLAEIAAGMELVLETNSDAPFEQLKVLLLPGGHRPSGGAGPSTAAFTQVPLKPELSMYYFDTTNRLMGIETYTGKGGCNGDSGGPAFIDNGETLSLVGATHGTSQGMDSVTCDKGQGTWTMVNLFQGWMKCTFAAHGNPLPTLADDSSSTDCQPESVGTSTPETIATDLQGIWSRKCYTVTFANDPNNKRQSRSWQYRVTPTSFAWVTSDYSDQNCQKKTVESLQVGTFHVIGQVKDQPNVFHFELTDTKYSETYADQGLLDSAYDVNRCKAPKAINSEIDLTSCLKPRLKTRDWYFKINGSELYDVICNGGENGKCADGERTVSFEAPYSKESGSQ